MGDGKRVQSSADIETQAPWLVVFVGEHYYFHFCFIYKLLCRMYYGSRELSATESEREKEGGGAKLLCAAISNFLLAFVFNPQAKSMLHQVDLYVRC